MQVYLRLCGAILPFKKNKYENVQIASFFMGDFFLFSKLIHFRL